MEELARRNLSIADVKFAFSNAGCGAYRRFCSTTLEDKLQYINLNYTSHLLVVDQFDNLFDECTICVTSSMLAFTPGPGFVEYHTAKCGLYEYFRNFRSVNDNRICVLCPCGIRGTNFYTNPLMRLKDGSPVRAPIIGTLEDSIISISMQSFVRRLFRKIILRAPSRRVICIGWASHFALALYKLIPMNVYAFVWSFLQLNRGNIQ